MMIPIPTDPEAQLEIVKAGRAYADSILLQPLREIGGILADQLGHWKQMNQVRCLAKTRKYMEEKGVNPSKLLPNVFVPLIEEAGNTDDETLSDMFARLLASHLDPSSEHEVHPAFAKVLGQLSPFDSLVLKAVDDSDRCRAKAKKEPGLGDQLQPVTNDEVVNLVKQLHPKSVTRTRIRLSLTNLERLGLCDDDALWLSLAPKGGRGNGWSTTIFGRRFLSACSEPGTYWWDEREKERQEAEDKSWERQQRQNERRDAFNKGIRATRN